MYKFNLKSPLQKTFNKGFNQTSENNLLPAITFFPVPPREAVICSFSAIPPLSICCEKHWQINSDFV